MKFNTDHHFVIGQEHVSSGLPCQDYAASGLYCPVPGVEPVAYAVVSDGCSSAGKTDIGSRLIALATVKALGMLGPSIRIDENMPGQMRGVSKVLAACSANHIGLRQDDMLATQLYAVVDTAGNAFTTVYGDGAIALVSEDGMVSLSTFEWKDNRPFYPHADSSRFIEAHGGYANTSLVQRCYLINPGSELPNPVETTLSVESGMKGVISFFNTKNTGIHLICLFTDGIMRVDKMSCLDVVRSLVGFKTLSGVFAKRRLIRFVKDSKLDGGVGPLDDIGLAAISIDFD